MAERITGSYGNSFINFLDAKVIPIRSLISQKLTMMLYKYGSVRTYSGSVASSGAFSSNFLPFFLVRLLVDGAFDWVRFVLAAATMLADEDESEVKASGARRGAAPLLAILRKLLTSQRNALLFSGILEQRGGLGQQGIISMN